MTTPQSRELGSYLPRAIYLSTEVYQVTQSVKWKGRMMGQTRTLLEFQLQAQKYVRIHLQSYVIALKGGEILLCASMARPTNLGKR